MGDTVGVGDLLNDTDPDNDLVVEIDDVGDCVSDFVAVGELV